MKYSAAVIFALVAAAVGHEGKCVYPTFTDVNLVVIDVDVNVLGLVDVNAAVAIDLVTVRQHYPECKAFYCCPNHGEPGEQIHPSCTRWE